MPGASLPARMPEGSGGTTYFCDAAAGSDANPGTLNSPFNSITKAFAAIAAAGGSGHYVYLRSNNRQTYRPAPGAITYGAGTSALTFTEVDGIRGQLTQVRLRSGGATVVTVYGSVIDIQFAAAETANGVKAVFDASAAATALCSCASGGAGAVAAVAWASGNSFGAVKDRWRASQPDTLGAHSHELYVSGTLGGSAPSTCNPITVETYPPDFAVYGAAVVGPRAGMANATPKNETGSDGVTAAALVGTNVPGGTGTITLVQAKHWPEQGSFTLAGITGTVHYTSRAGNTLSGLHDGGTAISGTVSASGTATLNSGLTDTYCLLHQVQNGTYVSAHRVRNVKLVGSNGNRGAGMWNAGNAVNAGTTFVEYYGVEATGHYYQAFTMDNASANCYFINCWSHHNGTGGGSGPSAATDTNTWPNADQHGIYLEGNNHTILNCVFSDIPYGFGIQYRIAGTGTIIAHCTVVRCGWGFTTNRDGGGVFDTITGATVKNTVYFDHKTTCFAENSALGAGTVVEDHCILSQLGARDGNHNYYGDNGGAGVATPSAWINETGGGTSLLTADPGFVSYAGRDLRPNAGSAIDTQAVDQNYSPGYDINGWPRFKYTCGAFEFGTQPPLGVPQLVPRPVGTY